MEDIATELTCILPGAFMIDALSRLPVKSLLRFSCVRKSWYNLVKDPRFIELHSDHSSKAENDTFIVIRSNKPFFRKMESEMSVIRLGSSTVEKTGLVEQGKLGIVGSSNGLVCLTYLDERFGVEFKVVNPALRQHQLVRKLPASGNYATKYASTYMSFGFGFDKTNGDYKILRIERLSKTTEGKIDWFAQINRYSFRYHSWKTIQPPENISFHYASSNLCMVTVGSRLYHISTDCEKSSKILAFDLSTEKLHTIPFPPRCPYYNNIMAWKNESLALILPNHDNIFPGGKELWVLNKDNSWKMTFKFSLDGLPDTLFVKMPESDADIPIFCGHEKSYSLMYLYKKKSDVFGLPMIASYVKSTRISSYRETLVPLCKPRSLKALKTKTGGSFKDGSKVYEKVPYVMRLQ